MNDGQGSRSIKGRLLALMAFAVMLSVVFSLLLAFFIYNNRVETLEETEMSVAHDYATRTMIWFRGAQRALSANAAGMAELKRVGASCEDVSQSVVRADPDLRAIWFASGEGASDVCAASRDQAMTPQALQALAETQKSLPLFESYRDLKFAPSRLGVSFFEGAAQILVYMQSPKDAPEPWRAMMMMTPDVLERILTEGGIGPSEVVLVDKKADIVVGGGRIVNPKQWLPQPFQTPNAATRMRARAGDGDIRSYATAPVIASNFAIVARFSEDARQKARRLFLALALAHLIIAATIYFLYARAIRDDVMRWIYGIKAAALDRISDPHSKTLAPIGPTMPRELRRVAEAFNEMVIDHAVREERLVAALEDNKCLTLELHHRVKNSLQVIQSYLSLSERLRTGQRRDDLMETAARVQVLSIAYRAALAEGAMRPLPIGPFCQDVVNAMKVTLRRPPNWVQVDADIAATLDVDRAIPMGLAVVEAIIAALHAPDMRAVRVELKQEDRCVTLRIVTDGERPPNEPNPKILRGLSLQVAAVATASQPGEIVNWSFTAD